MSMFINEIAKSGHIGDTSHSFPFHQFAYPFLQSFYLLFKQIPFIF